DSDDSGVGDEDSEGAATAVTAAPRIAGVTPAASTAATGTRRDRLAAALPAARVVVQVPGTAATASAGPRPPRLPRRPLRRHPARRRHAVERGARARRPGRAGTAVGSALPGSEVAGRAAARTHAGGGDSGSREHRGHLRPSALAALARVPRRLAGKAA